MAGKRTRRERSVDTQRVNVTCDSCGLLYANRTSLADHRRWHCAEVKKVSLEIWIQKSSIVEPIFDWTMMSSLL